MVVNEYVTVNAGQLVSAPASILLTNDLDPEGGALSIVKFGQASHGTFTQSADGTISYVSAPGFVGQDTVTYVVQDAAGNQTTGTIYLNVVSTANVPPTLQDEYATVQAGNAVTADPSVLLANDGDANGDKLTIVGFGKPTVGTLVQNADGTITYTAPPDYSGPATFTYTVSDGKGGESTATVYLTVAGAPNSAPVAGNDAANVAHAGSVTINVLANDTDANGDKLTVTGVNQPAHGSAVLNADGTVTYKANAGYSGTDTFTYTVADGKGGTSTATVAVQVAAAPNVAPVAGDDTANVAHAGSVTINVLANDTDANGDKLTVTGVNQPAHGSAVLNADGTVSYKANAGYSGTDTFTYTVADGKGGTSTATVAVNVAAKVMDLSAPDLVASNDSGFSNSDNYTNATKLSFVIGAMEKAGDVPNLYVNGVKVASTYDASSGIITAVNAIAPGNHQVTYTFTNAAGAESAKSAVLSVTIDTTAPTANVPDLLDSSDTGLNNKDDTTSDNRPAFSVGNVAPTDRATLWIDGSEVAAIYDADQRTIRPVDAIADGAHSVSLKVIDLAGNVSAASTALTIAIRTDVPPASLNTPDMLTLADSGSSNVDNITANTKPGFVVGEKIRGGSMLLLVDGVEVAATYDPVAKTLTPTVALTEGLHQISTINVSGTGVKSAPSPALTIDIDAIKETPTNGADMVAASDSGLSQTDNITNNTRPSFTVGAPPKAGDTMNLYIDNQKVDAVYDEAAGTLTPVAALTPGQHWVAWSVTNAAGVESGLAAIGDRPGVVATYYDGNWVAQASEVTSTVNQDWGFGGPAYMTDSFITSYKGKLVPPTTGEYTFQSWADNGVRLYVDGKLLIEDVRFEEFGLRTSGGITLEGGKEYTLIMEHHEHHGAASVDLRWREPGKTEFVTIPAGTPQMGASTPMPAT
ncbi:Ig-like domain-containing protein [Ideonella paludis]|uniref:Ig-like domain-containing protein n=1 Tax=Ideonella paludis TaxID=1233411 RepID=UPI003641652A